MGLLSSLMYTIYDVNDLLQTDRVDAGLWVLRKEWLARRVLYSKFIDPGKPDEGKPAELNMSHLNAVGIYFRFNKYSAHHNNRTKPQYHLNCEAESEHLKCNL